MAEPAGIRCAVECSAGYRGDETPRRLTLVGREIEVVTVEGRWREPDWRIFRVRGDDGAVYRLRQAVDTGRWELM